MAADGDDDGGGGGDQQLFSSTLASHLHNQHTHANRKQCTTFWAPVLFCSAAALLRSLTVEWQCWWKGAVVQRSAREQPTRRSLSLADHSERSTPPRQRSAEAEVAAAAFAATTTTSPLLFPRLLSRNCAMMPFQRR